MKRKLLFASLGAVAAAFVFAAYAPPANAIQERFRNCPCNSGFGHRGADPQDYVCVSAASRRTIVEENRTRRSFTEPNGYCKSGYVWRDAFDGDGTCVTPAARSRVHAENRRHRNESTKFQVQDPYSHCYLR